MSSANQIQQNSTNFYLDQYIKPSVILASVNAGPDTYVVDFRFHRQGKLVMVTALAVGANTGSGAGVLYYQRANAIPADCIPAVNVRIAMNSEMSGLKTQSLVSFETTGNIAVYPYDAADFAATSTITTGQGFYFVD